MPHPQSECKGVLPGAGSRPRLRSVRLVNQSGASMSSAVDELLLQRHSGTEDTRRGQRWEGKSLLTAEDGLAVDLDRGPPPQTADPLGSEFSVVPLKTRSSTSRTRCRDG